MSHIGLAHIQANYPRLRRSEQQIADYVLQNPEKVIYQSISEIAQSANVSEASVVRFCRAVGYTSFQDLRISLAKEHSEQKPARLYDSIAAGDSIEVGIKKALDGNMRALENTVSLLDAAKLKQMAARIRQARVVALLGLGTSGMVAEYAFYRLNRIGLFSCPYTDGHSIATYCAVANERHFVLAISQSGSSVEIVEAMEKVHQQGAQTACITGYPRSPLTRHCDTVLLSAVQESPFESGDMSSLISQLSVIDALVVGAALEDFDRSVEMIQVTAESVKQKKY